LDAEVLSQARSTYDRLLGALYRAEAAAAREHALAQTPLDVPLRKPRPSPVTDAAVATAPPSAEPTSRTQKAANPLARISTRQLWMRIEQARSHAAMLRRQHDELRSERDDLVANPPATRSIERAQQA